MALRTDTYDADISTHLPHVYAGVSSLDQSRSLDRPAERLAAAIGRAACPDSNDFCLHTADELERQTDIAWGLSCASVAIGAAVAVQFMRSPSLKGLALGAGSALVAVGARRGVDARLSALEPKRRKIYAY